MGGVDAFPVKLQCISCRVTKHYNVVTMESKTTDNDKDWESNPKTDSKGFVKKESWPECPRCGHVGSPVLSKKDGLSTLHCRECTRTLDHISNVTRSVDDDNLQYCALGDRAWGTGDTKKEAVQNMEENLGNDRSERFILYVADSDIQVANTGAVKTDDGEFLHRIGWREIDDY